MTPDIIHWVASFPKSGNTWVRTFIMRYLMPADMELNLNKRPSGFWQDCEEQFWKPMKFGNVAWMCDLPLHEALMMRPAACLAMIHGSQQQRCINVVKTHSCAMKVDGLGEIIIPPQVTGPSVYLYRDPRAVLPSLADHMGKSIEAAMDDMRDDGYCIVKKDTDNAPVFISSWSRNVASWLREDICFPVLGVAYEELRRDPDAKFREILKHLWPHLEIEEDRFERAMRDTSLESLRAKEDRLREAGTPYQAASPHAERFFRTGEIEGWREVLTEEQVNRVEREHGPMMRQLGYELETINAEELADG